MKDQMERIADEREAMQAEIEDLVLQLDAVGRTVAGMQRTIDAAQEELGQVRDIVQARDTETTVDAVARLRLRADQTAANMDAAIEQAEERGRMAERADVLKCIDEWACVGVTTPVHTALAEMSEEVELCAHVCRQTVTESCATCRQPFPSPDCGSVAHGLANAEAWRRFKKAKPDSREPERRCGTCTRWRPYGVQPTSMGLCAHGFVETYANERPKWCPGWHAKAADAPTRASGDHGA